MSMGKDYNDDELDELEDRAEGKADAEDAIRNAQPLAEEIKNLNIGPHVLSAIRDAFLCGKDLDAVAMLANELGMVAGGGNDAWKEYVLEMKPGQHNQFGAGDYTVAVVANRACTVRFRLPASANARPGTAAPPARPQPFQGQHRPQQQQRQCRLCASYNPASATRCRACSGRL